MKTKILSRCGGCLAVGSLLFLAGAPLMSAQNMNGPISPAGGPSATMPLAVSTPDATRPANALPREDRRFFRQAARLGDQEVIISRIAADRAIHPRVRTFAAEMVRVHGSANEELADLVRSRGAQLEQRDRVEVREEERKWNAKKGDDFDEDYLETIIDAHQDTIDVLENGADSKDPQIAAYAAKMLPAVKAHLAQAEALEDAVD